MNPTQAPPILRIESLGFAYPGQPALVDDWSACIGAGATLLFGDTGTGKSTLLRLMAGMQAGGTGRLSLAGVDLSDDPAGYARQVFFVDPASHAHDQVKASDCLGPAAASSEPARRALIEGFALAPHLDKPMYMLSTGSKRKVWLAAALAAPRPLTLLDEPTGGLDAASIRCLWQAVAELARKPDRAVVVASAERLDRIDLAATIELPLAAA